VSVVTIELARAQVEVKTFFRQWDSAVFTFWLPAVLLLILGSIFTAEVDDSGVTVSQVFTASMIAAGIASASFINLGLGIVSDRDDGTLKRLRGMPVSPVSYFLGKIALVLVVSVTEVVLLLGIGVLLFDLPLPTEMSRWVVFTWVFLLGTTACALLGIAASSMPRSARSAPAVLNLPFLVLQFISSVLFVPLTALPEPLVRIGSLFPLKWISQGFRSVFLPDTLAVQETAGAWEHGRVALVLAAWCIGGLVLCLATFRWRSRRHG